jgi:hypothetical protein
MRAVSPSLVGHDGGSSGLLDQRGNRGVSHVVHYTGEGRVLLGKTPFSYVYPYQSAPVAGRHAVHARCKLATASRALRIKTVYYFRRHSPGARRPHCPRV